MSKEKQIEEMAEDLAGRDSCKHLSKDLCNKRKCSLCEAEILYEAGYRKQSEGEWRPTQTPSYFGGVIYKCSLCGAKDGDHSSILGQYCWRCGAHMRKEDEGK